MKRNPNELTDREFDVIIVGGGIYGATIAWDAVLRGFSVALIEKDDFGGNTSSNSLKIVHGGLRYLQQLDIKRVRESVRERRIMLTIAPHLVQPLSCLMPTYGHFIKGPEVMFCGMLLNDILSADRNIGVDPLRKIPNCRIISKDKCLELLPLIDPGNVTGGAMWTDAQMYSSERLLLAFIKSASKNGACAVNYMEAGELINKNGKVIGVKAHDRLSGTSIEIRGRIVINAAGAWAPLLLGKTSDKNGIFNLSTAMNLVLSKNLFPETAAGIYGRYEYEIPGNGVWSGRRVLFATPWRGKTIIGTYHRPYTEKNVSLSVKRTEVEEFLKEVNSAVPGENITPEDVTFVQKGFLPMDRISRKTGEVILTKHYKIIDHKKQDGIEGLVSVIGVKYTTARDVAEKVMNVAQKKLQGRKHPSHSEFIKISGGDISSFAELSNEAVKNAPDLSEKTVRHLVHCYGTEYSKILDLNSRIKGGLVTGSDEVLEAEVVYAVREEAAQKLSDVVLRRTDLGSMGHPGKKAVENCADIMAKELRWSDSRKQEEIDETEKIYSRWM